jgi:UDP:flavonoid glycosyltransferase YjiC (YdhE family)
MSHDKKRIVLTTFGSPGDLHPYLALALGLQKRGHEAILATSEYYRQRIEALEIGFRTVRPDVDWMTNPTIMRRVMDLRRGTERVVREIVLPVIRQSYEDTLAAAEGADLLVSHVLTYATRLVAEKEGIPWVSSMLSPIGFFSAYDVSLFPAAPILSKLRFLGPGFWRPLMRLLKWKSRSWAEPLHRLRAEIGLFATKENPLVDVHSPLLVLAQFSRLLAEKQPDWPPQTATTGFAFHDGMACLPATLAKFLDDGPPPIVFTLGSSAVRDAGQFYEHSATAAKLLGHRAVLCIGEDPCNQPASAVDGVLAVEYAPFSQLFPRAAAIVHQGGIGTTGQAMRSGRPMLVVPYSHDQPDNAERVTRLGIARTVPRRQYRSTRVAAELRQLLDDPAYLKRASEVGAQVQEEDGVQTACDALESLVGTAGPI